MLRCVSQLSEIALERIYVHFSERGLAPKGLTLFRLGLLGALNKLS